MSDKAGMNIPSTYCTVPQNCHDLQGNSVKVLWTHCLVYLDISEKTATTCKAILSESCGHFTLSIIGII